MVNITNPVYTGVSDCGYYCHLTDTGIWLCDVSGDPLMLMVIGIIIGVVLFMMFIVIIIVAMQ